LGAEKSIARVAVEISLDRDFDYAVPEAFRAHLDVGHLVEVPFGRSAARGYILGFRSESAFKNLKEIKKIVGSKPLIHREVMKLAEWMADYYASPIEQVLKTVLPGAVRRKDSSFKEQLFVSVTGLASEQKETEALIKRAPKQAVALDALLAGGDMALKELVAASGTTSATIRALEEKGFVRIAKSTVLRDPHAGEQVVATEPHVLNEEQAVGLERTKRSIDTQDPAVVLLFGVTGSGKTEVYLQSIAYCLEKGQGAIVLVPEISLTPQTVERFRARFGDTVAVLHSHLSEGERHDEWHRVREGKARIVVGARSALFAPVENLGLIVVDEEHEPTYKQEESPRYNARDVAVMRGHLQSCAVLLGSATPSLESYANSLRGKYQAVMLSRRIEDQSMPAVRVIDMKHEMEAQGRPSFFSQDLIEAMRDRIQRQEQTILFLNRRGYSTSLQCPSCGETEECEHCSIAMTFHRKANLLKCHVCGYAKPVPARCSTPGCDEPTLKYSGLGTEKLEAVLQKLFPSARLARADSDSMTDKHAYRRVMGDVRSGKVDILIGTQMIAKGLHFPNVTLVGVVAADASLHMPDFRASERTFQLLTQVAGRAGRGDIMGEVIVQTYTPQHPAVQCSRRLDYEGFMEQELEFRKQLRYPPYGHMLLLTARGEVEHAVESALTTFHLALSNQLKEVEGVQVGEVSEAPVARVKGNYRFQILLRGATSRVMSRAVRRVMREFKWPKGVHCTVDVDPLSMM